MSGKIITSHLWSKDDAPYCGKLRSEPMALDVLNCTCFPCLIAWDKENPGQYFRRQDKRAEDLAEKVELLTKQLNKPAD